jgi:thymidylate synthase (FAD)
MKHDIIVSEPIVYLIGRPQFDLDTLAIFLQNEGVEWRRSAGATQAEEIIETAGRICYMSYSERQSPRTNTAYIFNLIAQGHESVLEHVSWTFILTNVSRAFTHQLVRHRVGFSFSQLSQQYHDESDAQFLMPMLVDHLPEAKQVWRSAMETAQQAYHDLMTQLEATFDAEGAQMSPTERRRAIRSASRSVMPNATATKIVVTANARAIRHFLTVRGSIPGDEEMRRVASAILQQMQVEAPALFADFHIQTLSDNSPIVIKAELETKHHES